MTLGFHPHPVPCVNCGTILKASYAEQSDFCCPGCGEPACYVCGCVEAQACVVVIANGDNTSRVEWVCNWADVGMCSHCMSRAVYELYQKATGRPADDPFYMNLGRSAFGYKSLAFGV